MSPTFSLDEVVCSVDSKLGTSKCPDLFQTM